MCACVTRLQVRTDGVTGPPPPVAPTSTQTRGTSAPRRLTPGDAENPDPGHSLVPGGAGIEQGMSPPSATLRKARLGKSQGGSRTVPWTGQGCGGTCGLPRPPLQGAHSLLEDLPHLLVLALQPHRPWAAHCCCRCLSGSTAEPCCPKCIETCTEFLKRAWSEGAAGHCRCGEVGVGACQGT